MMESTAPRRGVLWLTVLALAFTVVVIGADQASAAKPDPQVTLTDERIREGTTGACNYTTLWTISGVNGKWAWILIETRAAGENDWTQESLERQDIRANSSVVHTEAIFGTQPEYLETRVSVVKKNGRVEAAGTTQQACDIETAT